jgi:hypothetical protein
MEFDDDYIELGSIVGIDDYDFEQYQQFEGLCQPRQNELLLKHKRIISAMSSKNIESMLELQLSTKENDKNPITPKDVSIFTKNYSSNGDENVNQNNFSLTGFLYTFINKTMNVKQIRQVYFY